MKQIVYAVQIYSIGLLVLLKYTPVHLYPSDDFPRSDFTLNIQLNEIVVCMSLAYMYYVAVQSHGHWVLLGEVQVPALHHRKELHNRIKLF